MTLRTALFLALFLLLRPVAGDTFRPVALPTRDLVYDPYSQRLYASVPGSGGSRANSVTVVDPLTGTIGPSLPVGSEPGKLALTQDGRYLYVGLDGEGAVRRVDLRTFNAGPRFLLGADVSGRQRVVEDMEVLPGHPESVAVARRFLNSSPRFAGVGIYDDGVERPQTSADYPPSNAIEFSASAARLYGYDQETTDFSLNRMIVGPGGIFRTDELPDLLTGFDEEIRDDAGLLYASTGRVVDPEAGRLVGTFPGVHSPALVRPDTATGRVFFLTVGPATELLAYDARQFVLRDQVRLPGVPRKATSLVRWGPDGLAFRTDERIYLIRSSVIPVSYLSLQLLPPALEGGLPAAAQVRLQAPSPRGGAVIRLASSSRLVRVPPSITVPAGATAASFPLMTTPVATAAEVVISASYRRQTASATFRILPPLLTSLTFAPDSVTGGDPATGTVAVSGPAPAGGLKVQITSDSPAYVTLPTSVTVPAGASQAHFPVATRAVPTNAPVVISAVTANDRLNTRLRIAPPRLASLTFTPARVMGGQAAVGAVTLTSTAPAGGLEVRLYSSYPLDVPDTVTVPAGQRVATFPVTAPVLTHSYTFYVVASRADQAIQGALEVVGPKVIALVVQTSPIVGGLPDIATVTLDQPAPAGGIPLFPLSSSVLVRLPEYVRVPAGATSVSFAVTTPAVAAPTTVQISVGLGSEYRLASLELLPGNPGWLALYPAEVTGGQSVTGIVSLVKPAPADGMVVSLTSSDPADVQVPARVLLAPGSSTAQFTVRTQYVTAAADVTITANIGGYRLPATLTLEPVKVDGINIHRYEVVSGYQARGEVHVDAPAAPNGTVVQLTSENPQLVQVPPSVTVPAGERLGYFGVLGGRTRTPARVQITATTGRGDSPQTVLSLLPDGLASFMFQPPQVKGGEPASGVLTLTSPFPFDVPGDVQLSTDHPELVTASSYGLFFHKGDRSLQIRLPTQRTAVNTPVKITANLGGQTLTATLVVLAR
jgi:hypothetical protein